MRKRIYLRDKSTDRPQGSFPQGSSGTGTQIFVPRSLRSRSLPISGLKHKIENNKLLFL